MAPRRIDRLTLAPASPLAHCLAAGALRTVDTAPVVFEHDGERITAPVGEPLAIALVAAGRTTLARSAKYHRPRGPSCLRGACDGCLVRVDGVPNVMACRTVVRDGMRVTSQNAFPSAALDLLGVTDWFFPRHMDHHHLMVGLGPAVNRTMQVFARRMAGLGTLPDEPGVAVTAQEILADVLVVGAGASGTAAANSLASAGLDVLCVDEEPRPGGAEMDYPGEASMESLSAAVRFIPRATAVATFDHGTLVQCSNGLVVVSARARLLANGCHDLLGAFPQNDLPGIYTVRAFAKALCAGVLLGERVVVTGGGPLAHAVSHAARSAGATVTHGPDSVVREARGVRAVKSVVLEGPEGTRTIRCDALVVSGDAPAYELAGQAGAALGWDHPRGCFTPIADADGATGAAGVYVTGSVRGFFSDARARAADGRRVAARIARDLERPGGTAREDGQ